jgi:hypothetical protein
LLKPFLAFLGVQFEIFRLREFHFVYEAVVELASTTSVRISEYCWRALPDQCQMPQ